ncbi:MAG: DUF2997 domain-containing protein [Cyanobium sp.]
MDIQEIDVFVSPDGSVQLQVRGMQGRGCLSLTKGLEQLHGGEINSRVMRPEADVDPNEQSVSWQLDHSQSIGGGE